MSGSPEAHVQRVKEHLADGRRLLSSLGELQAYDIPEPLRDTKQNSTRPPAQDDPCVNIPHTSHVPHYNTIVLTQILCGHR